MQDTWDLSDLYSNNRSIERDKIKMESKIDDFQKEYAGKISNANSENFLNAIVDYEEINEICGKLNSYAFLLRSTNLNDEKINNISQQIKEDTMQLISRTIFFVIEINQIDEDRLQGMYKESEFLSKYSTYISNLRLMKKYLLSEKEEKILCEKNITSRHSWMRLFDAHVDKMKFDFDGRQLTESEIFSYTFSEDRETRKAASLVISETFKENIDVFTLITNVLAKDKEIEDRIRGMTRPITSRNISNYIEDEVVDSLIRTVKKNYKNLSHRYFKIKSKILGVKSLQYWDRNAPLPEEDLTSIEWNEAKKIVETAYKEFSPEMWDIGKEFFKNRWIDVFPREGKMSGAFSCSTVTDSHPYILLNYQKKRRDVITLAHELGHGVHQVLSSKNGILLSDVPLTLAETASVFCENIVFVHLLRSITDKKTRAITVAKRIEDKINTVVRQIAFCEFEMELHNKRKQKELSAEEISEIWMRVQKESLGEYVELDSSYKYFWSYIPHFIHSPFYVYSYAFGECIVNSLYSYYLNNPNGFQKKYINLLASGGSKGYKELLKEFDLDPSKDACWQGGLDTISDLIDEVEEIYF